MKYDVEITEILRRTVQVEAEDLYDAEEKVQNLWNDGEVILTADDFVEANFRGKEGE